MSTSSVALLQKHFDLALDAPDGIKKLRELILTLAMQGKLVPQYLKDQSASEFLNYLLEQQGLLFKTQIPVPVRFLGFAPSGAQFRDCQ